MRLKTFVSRALLCFLMSFHVVLAAESRVLGGVELQSSISLDGIGSTLVLNGAGIRYKFFFKIYVGGLYLPALQNDAQKILQTTQANRVIMHIVYDEVPKHKFVDAWMDGFKNNNEADVYKAVKQRLDQLNQMFTTLRKGDVVQLDYLPSVGTRVTIKNEIKGVIKGADFNRALLSVWLGEDPVTEELKSALLGLNED